MGNVATILIMMTILNVGLLFFGFDSGATTLFKFLNVDSETGQVNQAVDITGQLIAMLTINLGAGIAAGGLLFLAGQGQYAIFAGIVTWLLGFAFLPMTLLTRPEIPVMIKTLIIAPLFIMYILALVSFFRGNEL